MKSILYISAHSVLEYDELSLFTELGYDCFSLGAYTDPKGHYQLPRPEINNMTFKEGLLPIANATPRTELRPELIEPFDTIVIMDGYYVPEILRLNWEKIKHKKVVLRMIGQSLPGKEKAIKRYMSEGLKVVRYSPKETDLKDYAGGDAMIRFYKDPKEWNDWTGHDLKVVNFTQTLKGRRDFCGYDTFEKVAPGLPIKVYGSGNEDLGEFNGGYLPYDLMKGILRDSRAFLYLGTWPASYTLTLMEAMMTGIPVVAVGRTLARHKDNMDIRLYEVADFINNGDNGFVSDSWEQLQNDLKNLLNDHDLAKRIGSAGRETAIKLFGKDHIKEQWRVFLEKLW